MVAAGTGLVFVQMVQDPVCYSSDGPSVFADFIKRLQLFVFFCRFFLWCHFRMITDLEYLNLSVLEYMRNKIYFAESLNEEKEIQKWEKTSVGSAQNVQSRYLENW